MSNKAIKYPHNVLEGFGNGCLMDFRLRLAIDLLKYSSIFEGLLLSDDAYNSGTCEYAAKAALSISTELMKQAEELGYIDPLPANSDIQIEGMLRAQARRTARYQAIQQHEGPKAMEEEQGMIKSALHNMGRTGH